MKTPPPAGRGRPLSRAGMIVRVKALARARGKRSLSRRDLEHATGIGYHQMIRHFDSHNEMLAACGLQPSRKNPSVPDEALLQAMHDVFSQADGLVDKHKFDRTCRHRHQVYKARWGTWTGALRAYRAWLLLHHPAFPHLGELSVRCRENAGREGGPARWDGCGGARLGAPLNLAWMQHAPTNEMGVVFLFGALAPSLGYLVESLGIAFPDCQAKRRLRGAGEPWERVRIEFEFRSRNFLTHKHDARKCDLIVCWEDDWKDCPLEVLELKRELARFEKKGA